MAEMGGGTAAAPVAGHHCAPERVARAPNVMVHPYAWTRLQRGSVLVVELLTGERSDPARCSTLLPRVAHGPLRAALVDARPSRPGGALLRGGAACRDARRGARGRVHRVPAAAAL